MTQSCMSTHTIHNEYNPILHGILSSKWSLSQMSDTYEGYPKAPRHKRKLFVQHQEVARKDAECAFGVFQS